MSKEYPTLAELEQDYQRRRIVSMSSILKPLEMEIIRLTFKEDYTQAEIGKMMGVTQQAVNYHLQRALDRLRAQSSFIADL